MITRTFDRARIILSPRNQSSMDGRGDGAERRTTTTTTIARGKSRAARTSARTNANNIFTATRARPTGVFTCETARDEGRAGCPYGCGEREVPEDRAYDSDSDEKRAIRWKE